MPADWVRQSEVPSISRQTRTRTAYLESLRVVVDRAIREYHAAAPDGEEVTVAVMRAVGEAMLRATAGSLAFTRAKQDLGLFVAQVIVDIFGAHRVETLRRDDRRSVSTRRSPADLAWVGTYSPHRIVPDTKRAPRIILDTCVVRGVIHSTPGMLDLATLAQYKGGRPVSIADGAVAELAAALLRNAVPPDVWSAQIHLFDTVLDPDLPVAPGGRELAALWGAQPPPPGFDPLEQRVYYQEVWRYLRNVRSPSDLSRKHTYRSPTGKILAIQLDATVVDLALQKAGADWKEWVTAIGDFIRAMREGGQKVKLRQVHDIAAASLARDVGRADAKRLDLVVGVLARRAMEASAPRKAYDPKGEPNDVLDLDLLFAMPLPAWVCTADARFQERVRSTGLPDAKNVMLPGELIERLRLDGRGIE